jgi:hypothetical protein
MKPFLRKTLLFLAIPLLLVTLTFFVYSLIITSSVKDDYLNSDITEVFIGDSHVEHAVYDSLVTNGKNLGHSAESLYFSYFKIKLILETNPNIRTVYLGLGYHSISRYYDDYIFGQNSLSVSPDYFFILPLREQLKLMYCNRKDLPVYIKGIIKTGAANLKTENNFTFSGAYSNEFNASCSVKSSMDKRLKIQFYKDDKLTGFSEINLLYLNKIIDLCEKKNVDLVLINTPLQSYYRSKIPKEYLSKYKQIVSDHNLKLLDFSDMALDDSCYIPDGDHVSVKGALLMTKELNILKNKNR